MSEPKRRTESDILGRLLQSVEELIAARKEQNITKAEMAIQDMIEARKDFWEEGDLRDPEKKKEARP